MDQASIQAKIAGLKQIQQEIPEAGLELRGLQAAVAEQLSASELITTLQDMVDYFADSLYLNDHHLMRLLDLWSAVQEAQMQALMTRSTIVQAAEYLTGVHALANWVMLNSDDDGEVPIVVDELQAIVAWINREASTAAINIREAVFDQYIESLQQSPKDGFSAELWLKQLIDIAQTPEELATIEYAMAKSGYDSLSVKR